MHMGDKHVGYMLQTERDTSQNYLYQQHNLLNLQFPPCNSHTLIVASSARPVQMYNTTKTMHMCIQTLLEIHAKHKKKHANVHKYKQMFPLCK